MPEVPDLASVAALIADPGRAAMLSALLGGAALPAGDLARVAKISPQTASAHLAKLVQGGLLRVTTSGRHRYFRLAGKEVAQLLETMARIAPPSPARSLNQSLENQALRHARTCYDHLAGALGVAVTQALIERQWLAEHDETFEVTVQGINGFQAFGVDCLSLQGKRRKFAAACLDWSERRPHIGGALGASIAQRFFDLGWVAHADGSRALKVTTTGRDALKRELGIDWK